MITWALIVVVLALAVISIVMFRRLASRVTKEDCTPEWLENFSTSDYAPMQRLSDESDFAFLAAQPGYRPEIAAQLRAERREILTDYLQLLTRDFNQLHGIARFMLVYSTEDRPEFGSALFWQQIAFYYAVTALRCRLALMPLGFAAPDIRKLVQPIEAMRQKLNQVAA
jgi:hypothetical protein